jgi:hypothetical protein
LVLADGLSLSSFFFFGVTQCRDLIPKLANLSLHLESSGGDEVKTHGKKAQKWNYTRIEAAYNATDDDTDDRECGAKKCRSPVTQDVPKPPLGLLSFLSQSLGSAQFKLIENLIRCFLHKFFA